MLWCNVVNVVGKTIPKQCPVVLKYMSEVMHVAILRSNWSIFQQHKTSSFPEQQFYTGNGFQNELNNITQQLTVAGQTFVIWFNASINILS